jgi:plant G-box-binding factor
MQQHLMAAAAAAAGAPYGTPVPFPVSFHPAYYATHASMATVNAWTPSLDRFIFGVHFSVSYRPG